MASSLPPVKNAAFTFDIALVSQADTDTFKASPTLAAGDVKVAKDGGAFANIGTLPTQIGTTGVLPVALTADEMNADRVTVLFHDAAGDEWQDALVTIYTAGQTLDTTDGVADAIKAKTDGLPAIPAAVGSAMTLTAAYDAAKSAAQAGDEMDLTADAIADVTAAAQAGGVTVNTSVAVSRAEAEDVASGRLSIRSYHTLSQEVSSTSSAALDTATKAWLIIKTSPDQTDDEALVRIEAGTGLERLAGVAYETAAHGSLVLGGSAGAWTFTAGLDKVAAGLLHNYAASGLYAEIKAELPSGATVAVWDGKAAIHKGIVRSVSDDGGGGIPT